MVNFVLHLKFYCVVFLRNYFSKMNVKLKAAHLRVCQYFSFSLFKKIIFINRFNKLPNYVSLYFCNERSKYENENHEVITSRDDLELNP